MVATIVEHEDEPQMFQEETVTKTQFYEMEGILHKQTGEILTFVEAIKQGLLDLSSGGEFFDIASGSRISLEKAAELGYVNENISEILNGYHGIKHPETGKEITLLEAIQIGLYDPDSRQLRDIKTGEILSLYDCISRGICDTTAQHRLLKMGVLKLPPMSLDYALKNGVLDHETGEYKGKYVQDKITLRDALANGYIQFSSQTPIIAITLSDCIKENFIDALTGEFRDINSNDKFTLRDLLVRGKELICDNVREIINTDSNQRVTLNEAILCHAINLRQGNFTDLKNRNTINLREAFDSKLISKPKTLTEAIDSVIVDLTGYFTDCENRYTLIEAINAGVLDPDVRHIVDQNSQDVISIIEALERGILTPDGKIVLEWGSNGLPSRLSNLHDAYHDGLLTKRVCHTIFEVKGIKNVETNTNLSFNEAVESGVFILPAERIINLKTKISYLLSDAVKENLIDPMLQEILSTPIGLVQEQDISLARAVSKGIIDAKKGIFFDKYTKRELSPREAYENGYINLKGAIKLSALFDVHPLLMTPIKKHDKKKRIRRPGQQNVSIASDQIKVTLSEAMKQGLIDSRTQRYRQGNTEMSLDDALSQGLIDPLSEWIIPSRALTSGPTIEEKTQETVTETGQQLAPKIFPDKQYEESINTIKRVKRTETSAVDGLGGISVYRAITGGKDTIQVPNDGYHILEAERNGILNLTKGIVTLGNKTLTLEDAFNLGVLNLSSVMVIDDKTKTETDFIKAFENKIIDKNGFIYKNGQKLSLQEAIDQKIVHVKAESVSSVANLNKKIIQFSSDYGPTTCFRTIGDPVIEEHEQSWFFDSTNGLLVDTFTKEKITLDVAIRSGKLSNDDICVRDALTNREMSLTEAEKWGIVNLQGEYYYLNKNEKKRYTFTEAACQRWIYPTGGVPDNASDAIITTVKVQTRSEVSKKEAIPIGDSLYSNNFNINKFVENNLYDLRTGLFTHPENNQKQVTLKELIVKGFLNPYATFVLDRQNGEKLNLFDAIDKHIVDDIAGTVKDTITRTAYDFATALQRNLIIEDTVENYIYEHSNHPKTAPNFIDDNHSSRFVERKLQLTSYGQEPFNHHRQEIVSPSLNSNKIDLFYNNNDKLNSQITNYNNENKKMVDLGDGKNVLMTVVKGEDGLEKGEYFDPNTGMKFTIKLYGDPYVTQTTTKVESTSQVKSIELEPHAQFVGIDQIKDLRNNRIMSLKDAKRLGLAKVDKKGKQTTKSYSAFRSNIELAVNKGVIDREEKKISLEEAIKTGILDIQQLKYIHPKTNEALDLSKAANMGLIDVTLAETLTLGVTHPGTNEKITIQRAINAGIINPHSGEVKHPFTNERLSWIDLTKFVYNSITMNGIYDPKKGYAVSINSALIDKLIDAKNEKYINYITNEQFSFDEANEKGFIDFSTLKALTQPFLYNYRTNQKINIVQAFNANIFNPRNKTIQVSSNKILSIEKAIKEKYIPAEIGDHLKRVDKLTFAEAVSKGLIDVAQDSFTDVDTGKQMKISEAVDQGFIDTENVESLENTNYTNLTKILNSDRFDERSGRIQDNKTNLYLNFRDAVDQRIIDPDSLLHDIDSSKTITLREALNFGLISNDGKYVDKKTKNIFNLNEAVRHGFIALIASPMQAAQAVSEAIKRRDNEGYKFRLESLDNEKRKSGSNTYSQPKFREESTIIRLTPQRTEPSLSVRVRSHNSDDLRNSGRAHSLIDDPIKLVDLQDEFFEKLQNNSFNLDDKIIGNLSTMRHVSIREAVENGLFDVVTNEILHPISGRHYSIPKAIQIRLILPTKGKQLMEILNIKSDELSQTSPIVTSKHLISKTVNDSDFNNSNIEPDNDVNSWTRKVSWQNSNSQINSQSIIPDEIHSQLSKEFQSKILLFDSPKTDENFTTSFTSPNGTTKYTNYYISKNSYN